MPSDPVADYQAALKAAAAAQADVQAKIKAIEELSEALRHWERASISGSLLMVPGSASVGTVRRVNADLVPSAKEVLQSLAQWQTCRDAARRAWDVVPNDRRFGLMPPASPAG